LIADDFLHRSEPRSHLDHRLLRIAPRTVGILFWWEGGFKDRFQHQHRCCHADSITQGRDAQRPELAVGLRYEHSSDTFRSVSLLPDRRPRFADHPLPPIPLDSRNLLATTTCSPLVGAP